MMLRSTNQDFLKEVLGWHISHGVAAVCECVGAFLTALEL